LAKNAFEEKQMFQIVKYDAAYELIGKARFFGWMSALLLLASIAAVIFIGPTYGIDFQGGTDLILKFNQTVDAEDVREAGAAAGLPDVQVQRYGAEEENRFLVQTRAVSVVEQEEADAVADKLAELGEVTRFDWAIEQPNRAEVTFTQAVETDQIRQAALSTGLEEVEVNSLGRPDIHRYELRFEDLQRYVVDAFTENFPEAFDRNGGLERMETVGARVGEQFRNAGILSIMVALIFILIYIGFRFDMRYAPGAVAALTHDVIIAVGFFTVAQIEFSLPIVAALLTIVGYSLNDTIVVFDRIRENLESTTDEPIDRVVNRSINETLSRTVITSLTTLLAVTAIAVLGGGLIQDFAVALIVGVLIGTYSSVFVASPVMLRMDGFLKARREVGEIIESQKSKESTA
jgi:preprotein translocase subunit SecF